MILRKKYVSLPDTLNLIKIQVKDSLKYCKRRFSGFDSPENLFFALKSETSFKEDPKGVELLQSVPSLFENNRHGIPGAGDCDCFTILALACFAVNGFNPSFVVLAGRSSLYPVHIFAAVGPKITAFDLTNSFYGFKRPYPLEQVLPFRL